MKIGTMFLLARYADCAFWVGRSMARADNLARILDVNLHFSRNSRGSQNWRSNVQHNADEERFDKACDVACCANVVHFYVLGREKPSSIISTVRAAKENARAPRSTIASELRSQLNGFNRRVHPLGTSPKLVAACLLFSMSFPRSVALWLSDIDGHLHHLSSGYRLPAGDGAMELLDETRAARTGHSPDTLAQSGLHEFSDYLQRQLMAITKAIRREFCGVAEPDAA